MPEVQERLETLSRELAAKVAGRSAKITIVGLGYVGLPTAVHLAKSGFHVTGADVDANKVDAINAGRSPLAELELGKDVAHTVAEKRLQATADTTAATKEADIISLIVPTPVTADKTPDLSFVEGAARAVAAGLKRGQMVVLESTTYPGTCEEILIPILEESGLVAGTDFGVAYCPERYNPGDAQHTLATVHRVVGGITPEWADVAKALYGTLNGGQITVMSSLRTAEATKVIENVQRDLNIALVNELALICEKLGIDVQEVIDGAATKWNFHPYRPGPGVGGHCLPVDPYYLTSAAKRAGVESRVILAGRAVNDGMPAHVVKRLEEALNGLAGKKIGVLGLAYKAGTGDARGSPATVIVKLLLEAGADVRVHDPHVEPAAVERLCGVAASKYQACIEGADAVALLTDHAEYHACDLSALAAAMAGNVALDTRRIWTTTMLEEAGLQAMALGRPLALA